MLKLRYIAISCPSQEPTQRYRRDVVDYALTSLRIAIELAHPPKFSKLTLNHRPQMGEHSPHEPF